MHSALSKIIAICECQSNCAVVVNSNNNKMLTAARCPRSRRNLLRFVVFVAATVALLTYFRLLLPNKGEEEDEEPMDEAAIMRMYLRDKTGFLERKIVQYERRIVPNLGHNGEPAYLEGKEKEMGEKALKTVALNTALCDRVPLNRTLRDPRNKG